MFDEWKQKSWNFNQRFTFFSIPGVFFLGSQSKAFNMPEKQFILDTSPPSAETQKIAEVELNETPERVEESVAELRRLLHENEDLHYDDDDKTLKLFLRPCHFYPESAIKLVSTSLNIK